MEWCKSKYRTNNYAVLYVHTVQKKISKNLVSVAEAQHSTPVRTAALSWILRKSKTRRHKIGTEINRNVIKEKKTISDKKNLFRELITLNV